MVMKLPLVKRSNTDDEIKHPGKFPIEIVFLCVSQKTGYNRGLMVSNGSRLKFWLLFYLCDLAK